MPTQYRDTEIITGAERTASGPLLCSRPGAGYRGGESVALAGSGVRHRPVDVAFDSAYGQRQSFGPATAWPRGSPRPGLADKNTKGKRAGKFL
jgi:hypothetical protein